MKLLNDQKYLGIFFSNNPDPSITINKSFDIALNKFNDRANLFKAAFSKMDLRRRVSAFNIFLASLFSYVIGFYLPPHHIYHAFKTIASWLIIPYSGTGYIYEYLVVPGRNGGSPFSVQDLFVSAMLRQISATDVTSYINDKSIRPWPLNSKDACLSPTEKETYRRDHRFFKSTPLISDHRQLAVMDFISKNYLNIDDNSETPLNGPALSLSLTKPRIKEILINRGFTEHSRFTGHFYNKHNYWSCPEHPPTSPISVVYDRLPLSIRVTYFRLFTNSAATSSRTRFSPMKPSLRTLTPSPALSATAFLTAIQTLMTKAPIVSNTSLSPLNAQPFGMLSPCSSPKALSPIAFSTPSPLSLGLYSFFASRLTPITSKKIAVLC